VKRAEPADILRADDARVFNSIACRRQSGGALVTDADGLLSRDGGEIRARLKECAPALWRPVELNECARRRAAARRMTGYFQGDRRLAAIEGARRHGRSKQKGLDACPKIPRAQTLESMARSREARMPTGSSRRRTRKTAPYDHA